MTRQEYIDQNLTVNAGNSWTKPRYPFEYSEPLFDCPKCGGDVRKNMKHGTIDKNGLHWFKYVCDRCESAEYMAL